MKKKTVLLLFLLILSICILNINVLSAVEENNYRPTSLEWTPHDPISITSDSGLEVFPGIGTIDDPYIIEGYNITTTDYNGIYIRDTTKYFIIRNCYIDADDRGIDILNVTDGTAIVINNTCTNNNYWYGIILQSSSNSTVVNNTCYNINVYHGIYLYESGYSTVTNNTCSNNNFNGIVLRFSDSSIVKNNTCNNNDNGIVLRFSDSSTVINNTCNNNSWGISLSSSGSSTVANNTCNNNGNRGISLDNSGSITIVNNMCSNNNYYGISLFYSDFCVATYNLLQENGRYGVHISNSANNLIHHNTFVDNNLGGTSQACDHNTNNLWYDSTTQEGNDWSDWNGSANYSIDGSAGSVDLYPLGVPVIVEYPQIVLLTLILSIVTLFLTRIISKQKKK